jgi:hypothetical protein
MIKKLDEQDKATHVNVNETEEEVQGECLVFDDDLNFDTDNIEIEEGDHVFMAIVHLVDPQHFICALSIVFWTSVQSLHKDIQYRAFIADT